MSDQIQFENEEVSQEDLDQIKSDIEDFSEDEKLETENESQSETTQDHNDSEDPEMQDKNDEEREAIRERRRLERQQKKQHAKAREEGYKREIAGLRRQLQEVNEWRNSMDQKSFKSGVAQLDNAMRETDDTLELAKRSMKEATASQNGDALADATELYYAARKRKEDLERIKQQVLHQSQRRQAPTIDPTVVQMAQTWMQGKTWYDPASQNMDSSIVMQIDKQLNQEGWDPRTPEYWQELDERAKQYIPHRYKSEQNVQSQTARRPPTSGGDKGNGGKVESYSLSADRVKALKEAGMWDDPVKRKQMIKRYMEQDKSSRK